MLKSLIATNNVMVEKSAEHANFPHNVFINTCFGFNIVLLSSSHLSQPVFGSISPHLSSSCMENTGVALHIQTYPTLVLQAHSLRQPLKLLGSAAGMAHRSRRLCSAGWGQGYKKRGQLCSSTEVVP